MRGGQDDGGNKRVLDGSPDAVKTWLKELFIFFWQKILSLLLSILLMVNLTARYLKECKD